MAEDAGDPPSESDRLSQRIKEWVASGKALQHVQEGFYGQTQGFLDLQGFKDRESGRKRPEVSKGQLHQGSAPSQAEIAAEAAELEDEASRTCIWCSALFESVEALDAHEFDCEP